VEPEAADWIAAHVRAFAYFGGVARQAVCEQEMTEAVSRGWADRDASIFLTLQEECAKVQVRLPAASNEVGDPP
jgi:hypothetical protein